MKGNEPYPDSRPPEGVELQYGTRWVMGRSDAWLIFRGLILFGIGVALLVLAIVDILPGQWWWLIASIPFILLGLTMIICGWAAPCYKPPYNTDKHSYLSAEDERRLVAQALPLDSYVILGSHNSCHVANCLSLLIAPWRYTHAPPCALLDMGIRSVELDIWYSRCSQVWRIMHEFVIDGLRNVEEDTIISQFKEINAWSNRNPGHFPLILNIDIKGSYGMLPWIAICIGRGIGTDRARDSEALASLREDAIEAFGSKLFTPTDLGKGEAPLYDWLKQHPWPTVDRLKGKVLLFLNIYSDRSGLRHAADHSWWWVRSDQEACGDCVYSEKDGDGFKKAKGVLRRFSAWTGGELCCVNGVSEEEEAKGREKIDRCRGEGALLIASDHLSLIGPPSVKICDFGAAQV
eukprot:Hpha_TRINITY_DN12436_c0_g1::TRINITY_DN12436_c0_g1_i1::g.42801::m.42801